MLSTNATVIGINNRDLTNFNVTIDTSLQLVKYIPEGTIVVSESGLDSKESLLTLHAAGFDAFLACRRCSSIEHHAGPPGSPWQYGRICRREEAYRLALELAAEPKPKHQSM